MTDKYSKKAESATALTGGRRGKKENNNKNFASRKAFEERKRQGRPHQVWMQAATKNAPVISDTMRATKKGEVGAIPMKIYEEGKRA
jgi:hypothetical protein